MGELPESTVKLFWIVLLAGCAVAQAQISTSGALTLLGRTTVTRTQWVADTNAPTVAVTNQASYLQTNANLITISGTASDNVGIASITWTNSRGYSGIASGTTNWSVAAASLVAGTNIFTITARDAAANIATATVTANVTNVLLVGLYLPFESGATGAAPTPLMMTNLSKGSLGEWSVSQNGSNYATITTNETPLRSLVNVGGTIYDDNGSTRGIGFRLDQLTNYVQVNFTGSYTSVAACAWMTFASLGGSFQTIDYMQFADAGGKFAVMQTGGGLGIHPHANTNSITTVGSDITTNAPGVTYFVGYTFTMGSPGTVTGYIYATDGSFFGTSSCLSDAGPMVNFRFGRVDAHLGIQPPSTSVVYFDDVMVFTNGVQVLGP